MRSDPPHQHPPQPDPGLTVREALRGQVVDGAWRWVGFPVSRRAPLNAMRAVHRLARVVTPGRVTDADPFTVVWVAPDRITGSVLERAPRHPQWGRVRPGGWDVEPPGFWERPVPQAIQQRFREDQPWERTPLFEHYAAQLRRFGRAWGYTSPDGFSARCEVIEAVYERIRREGYRSQAALAAAGDPNAIPVLDEINVDIGRDGELLWRGYGQHRLAIARVLGVQEVPVLVHRRHREWQAVRETIRAGGGPGGYAGHPDLRDLQDPCVGRGGGGG